MFHARPNILSRAFLRRYLRWATRLSHPPRLILETRNEFNFMILLILNIPTQSEIPNYSIRKTAIFGSNNSGNPDWVGIPNYSILRPIWFAYDKKFWPLESAVIGFQSVRKQAISEIANFEASNNGFEYWYNTKKDADPNSASLKKKIFFAKASSPVKITGWTCPKLSKMAAFFIKGFSGSTLPQIIIWIVLW